MLDLTFEKGPFLFREFLVASIIGINGLETPFCPDYFCFFRAISRTIKIFCVDLQKEMRHSPSWSGGERRDVKPQKQTKPDRELDNITY